MLLARIAGIVGIVALLIMGVGPGRVGYFIDLPTLTFIVGLTACFVMLAHSPRTWPAFGKALVCTASDEEMAVAGQVAQTGLFAAFAAGLVATMIGFIAMVWGVDDPAALGPGLAVSSLPAFYGMLLGAVVCYPVLAASRSRAGTPRGTPTDLLAVLLAALPIPMLYGWSIITFI